MAENMAENSEVKRLGLWKLISNGQGGYDSYDSCVVVSESKEKARYIHPGDYGTVEWWRFDVFGNKAYDFPEWCHPDKVDVMFLGYLYDGNNKYKEGDVVCASFNAG